MTSSDIIELCSLSAVEAAARFREKSLSPVELLEALILRAETVEPQINAFTYCHYDQAREAAKRAEALFRSKSRRLRPLEGIPVAVKDSSDIQGMPGSKGSFIYKDYIAPRTSIVNERVLEAGAIVHARTTTPEFSCAPFTWSDLWGVTRSPWNLNYTPGGSSGGAGASLAAGTTLLATGSDIGGSIRIPASCSGIVGYKPPHGRNPMDPPLNLDPYCHSGPMARTVRDVLLMQNIMSGPHPKDITSLRPKILLDDRISSIKGMKIALSMDLGFFRVDSQVRANTERAAAVFRDSGAMVEPIILPWTSELLQASITHLKHIFGTAIAAMLPDHADKMTGYARAFAEAGLASTPRDYVNTLQVAADMYEALGDVFEHYDALICPTTALPAVPADYDPLTTDLEIDGGSVDPFLGWCMTSPFNMMSRCPVLAVPSGHASTGIPTGIQIVGRPFDDDSVFKLGLAYEDASGPWITNKHMPLLPD